MSEKNYMCQQPIQTAYRFLVRIADTNDIKSVPLIATITDAYYSNDREKIVCYLKETRQFIDNLINDLK